MSVRIPAEAARLLGVPQDPAAFVMACFNKIPDLRVLHTRVVHRINDADGIVKVVDIDSKSSGNQTATIQLAVRRDDSIAMFAAKFAVALVKKNAGPLYIDEQRRMQLGLPEGPKRAKSLDNPDVFSDELLADDTVALIGAPAPMSSNQPLVYRSFDPVSIAAVGAIVVPILVAVLPAVLPVIIEWGSKAFKVSQEQLTKVSQDIGLLPKDAPATDVAPAPKPRVDPRLIVAAAVIVGAWIIWKKA